MLSSWDDYPVHQTADTFVPSLLDYNTTYYWRIDEINAYGITSGQVWTFTTGDIPPR